MSDVSKFKVAICGGGVGGIVAAYALGKCENIEVDIYEAASRFAEIGAGIGIGWRAWSVLQELGLDEVLQQYTHSTPSMNRSEPFLRAFRSDQPEPSVVFANVTSRGGTASFLRSDFHGAIIKQLSPRVRTFTSKRLVSYETSSLSLHASSDKIHLNFKDGSTATCDILIGADGVKSAVRACMFEGLAKDAENEGDNKKAEELRAHIKAKFSGAAIYRTLIPAEALRKVSPEHPSLNRPAFFLGKNLHLVSYPVAQGNLINLAVTEVDYTKEGTLYPEPWSITSVDCKPLIRTLANWEPNAQVLGECMEALTVSKWAVNVVPGLPSFASSSVALLGDAAHAMTPNQGSGAGQGIEDAYILSALLTHPLVTRVNISKALAIYSDIRLPFAYMVFERSNQMGRYFAFYDPENPEAGSGEWDLERLAKDMQKCADWQIETALPQDEKERAVQMLERST